MYTKLFASILDSSIWAEDAATCKLWVTLLAMADEHGMVYASPKGLAHRAHLSDEDCTRGLAVLMAPDPDSRTPDHEGRRIERVAGGWLLLNHAMYREIRTKAQMSNAARQARFRAKHGHAGVTDNESNASNGDGVTRDGSNETVTGITTTASASPPAVAVDLEKAKDQKPVVKESEHPPFDETPFAVFGDNAQLVIELVRGSHKQAAVASSIFKHTLGSYNAGMAGAPVAHADVVGAAVQAYLANMKPGDAFVDRLFGGYVRDAIRTMGAGEQRERAKREDSHVDRERAEEERRQREDAEIVRKVAEFKRTEPEAFARYTEQSERAVPPQIKGIFRAPTVRAKLVELIDRHDGGAA